MHTTNIFAVLLSVTLATGFYIPPRPLAPNRADTHRELHSRQVIRDVDPLAPFRNANGSSAPGPVYGFPGDLVDPNPPAPASTAPGSEAPAAPEAAPVDTPIPGSPPLADTSVPVSVPQPDSSVEVVAPTPVTPESQPAPVEPAPAPVEPIVAALAPEAPAPTPAANLPIVGADDDGNEVHVEYAFSTRWSTEVVYVTAAP